MRVLDPLGPKYLKKEEKRMDVHEGLFFSRFDYGYGNEWVPYIKSEMETTHPDLHYCSDGLGNPHSHKNDEKLRRSSLLSEFLCGFDDYWRVYILFLYCNLGRYGFNRDPDYH